MGILFCNNCHGGCGKKKHVYYVLVVCLCGLLQLLYISLGNFDPNLGVHLVCISND